MSCHFVSKKSVLASYPSRKHQLTKMDEEQFGVRVQQEVQQAVANSQRDLMDQISGLISSKFGTFEARFSENQRELSEFQLSKIQQNILTNDNYQFKKKSCEDQFKFNSKVIGTLRDAEVHADNDSHRQELKQDIAEGIKLLNHRQKLIRMADASDLGWRIVDEYMKNPLASDEEDEKRMNRAEARASKKVKQERQKKQEKWQKTRNGRYHPYVQQGQATATVTSAGAPINTVVSTPRRQGVCFECGMPNHWKYECPNRKAVPVVNNKISNFSFDIAQSSNFSCDIAQSRSVCHTVLSSGSMSLDNTSLSGQSGEDVNIESQSLLSNTITSNQSPVGRLKECVSQWEVAGTNDYILSVVKGGYRIPFKDLPDSVYLKNNRSARENPTFVSSEIKSLLEKQCIVKVSEQPYVINPLTVAYNRNGKPRLVLDCRHINHLLCSYKFKYEDVSVVKQLFKQGDYAFCFDLKSAYHHIQLFDLHRTYCGFAWTEQGRTDFYTFCVLPFGLKTAGYIFSKLMRVVVAYWRSMGFRIVMFLDDGIGGDKSYQEALHVSKFVRESLPKFGFLIAEDKCSWEPSQVCTWLGYVWRFIDGFIFVTEERIRRLEATLDSLLFQLGADQVRLVPVRFLACVVGQIISLQNVIGKLVRLKTRFLYRSILSRLSWNSLVHVDDEALGEIRFWRQNVRLLNDKGMSIAFDSTCEIDAFSDASAVGYGGYLSLCAGALAEGTEVFGAWNHVEKLSSSTYREAEAVRRVLNSHVNILQGKKVKWFSDNKNVKNVLRSGSSKSDLQEIALDIHETCNERGITLIPEWICRSENEAADGLSRGLDSDDWQIQTWVFEQIDQTWGKHTVDRFASNLNAHCSRFNSRFWCPGTEGVDAFDQCWSGECNWIVPPPRDLLKVFAKLERDEAKGTVILPLWKSAPFWPVLQPYQGNFAQFVKDVKVLPQYNVIQRGNGNNGIFGRNPLTCKLMAVKVDFAI